MALNEIQRRIKRSKVTERNCGHWLKIHDGEDPFWKNIASSALRVGHVTGLQFDVISKTYAAECKNVKLPATMIKWWLQIGQVAQTHGKEPLLYIEPTNDVKILGVPKKVASLHIITEARHAQLLKIEQEYETLAKRYDNVMESLPVDYDDMFPEDEDE